MKLEQEPYNLIFNKIQIISTEINNLQHEYAIAKKLNYQAQCNEIHIKITLLATFRDWLENNFESPDTPE